MKFNFFIISMFFIGFMKAQNPLIVTCEGAAACAGSNNGTAEAFPNGGTMPYSYFWSNGATTKEITGLSNGTYTVTVTDATPGSSFEETCALTLTELSTSTTSSDESCGDDGFATATPSGGTIPYSYLWSDGQTTQTATNLSDGMYTYTLEDGNSCTLTENVVIAAAPSFTASIQVDLNVTCSALGALTAVPMGGTAPHSFVWSNIGPGQETQMNLEAGPYTVTITDKMGCTAIAPEATIVDVCQNIPTLGQWGLITLALGLLIFSIVGIKIRHREPGKGAS